MNWIALQNDTQLDAIVERSFSTPAIIFKHSTRCSISVVAKNRLDVATQPDGTDFYYLDLLNFRDISNKITERFKVFHESPQVLLIKNGECIYDESHNGIRMEDIKEQLSV